MVVRPHGAPWEDLYGEGEIRLNNLHLKNLKLEEIYHRSNEIDSLNKNKDVYCRTIDDKGLARFFEGMSKKISIDLTAKKCYYALSQVDFYIQGDDHEVLKESDLVHKKISSSRNRPTHLGELSVLKAGRMNTSNFSGTKLAKKGFGRICNRYVILLAENPCQ